MKWAWIDFDEAAWLSRTYEATSRPSCPGIGSSDRYRTQYANVDRARKIRVFLNPIGDMADARKHAQRALWRLGYSGDEILIDWIRPHQAAASF